MLGFVCCLSCISASRDTLHVFVAVADTNMGQLQPRKSSASTLLQLWWISASEALGTGFPTTSDGYARHGAAFN